ncbi:MAG: cation:proton antiporter [Deltaproteobacteria bacterium]|nr:cation:proton antiporter [Deltaproteobacteria bacterium]MBW2307629.1 cation:proton antiporter [Deltaproteobacteria bacterium]
MNPHLMIPFSLISAKLLEQIMSRIRFPAVVGAILAGFILGPALLGVIPSETSDPQGYEILRELAYIGLCVLLFRIGLETQLTEFLPVWRSATGFAVAGMAFPFVLGWLLSLLWGWPHQRAIFVGATLTATSIGVTESVLSELRAEKSREGVIIIGAAVLDDVLALILLSIIASFVTPALSVTEQILRATG